MDKVTIPDHARFLGYVCHLVESDEFLLECDDLKGIENWLISKTPGMAKVFDSKKKAEKFGEKYDKNRVEIVHLYETKETYYIAKLE